VLAVLAVVIAVLPASLANRFLPPAVRAEDFSGTLWHGSAGRITVAGRDAGALEWHLHPLALFKLASMRIYTGSRAASWWTVPRRQAAATSRHRTCAAAARSQISRRSA
jgi:hypothetical protein